MSLPTFGQLKKIFLDSGYEIRFFPSRKLEQLALDSPSEVKRHVHSNIMGLIMPDENAIGIADELEIDEKVATLIHELIHLSDSSIDEEEVEAYTVELESSLTPAQFGFLQFLVS